MGFSGNVARVCVVLLSCYMAVRIRMFAVINYGRVIHEFDPWFNFRATEYMVEHGWAKFQAWYDDKVWYPLGRHVGSTTYPGLQLTAWLLHTVINWFTTVSLNDVCVLIPAGFGAIATLWTGMLSWEVTRSANAAVTSTFIMAILPAHLMRSVAGGYDNESIAITAIVATFYLWVRSVRTDGSWPVAILAGLSYVYMVAAWGGYVFVLNLIGIHAGVLVLLGRFSPKLWRAYSVWFVIGTAGAIFGPARYLVGWQPFQSLEQLGPFAVFLGLQLLQVCDVLAKRRKLDATGLFVLRVQVFGAAALAAALCLAMLPNGFVGPLSARVRGLFIKHTKTGNPLVDSVAEHQATPPSVYWQYYHIVAMIGPIGGLACTYNPSDAKVFFLVYGFIGAYFSSKMIRLVLLLSPAACVAAGAFVGIAIDVTAEAFGLDPATNAAAAAKARDAGKETAAKPKGGMQAKLDKSGKVKGLTKKAAPRDPMGEELEEMRKLWDENVEARRNVGVVVLLVLALIGATRFVPHCWGLAQQLSEPQIMLRGRGRAGETVMIDDFREAYWWLRDRTPEDARVMAWWDYGYQINGVGNRTTIADGNTWNHEHIALLGKCLTANEADSHAIVRHMADYVLIWTTRYAGMYSDDLAKSPHMARIGSSVYGDRIGCHSNAFYMDQQGTPSPCMKESVLWRMHSHRFDPEAAPLELFEEAFTTQNRMVRIYKVLKVSKKSKEWRAAQGIRCSSDECYPPALKPTLELKESFKQIHGL